MQIEDINIDIERKPIKHIHLAVYPPEARVHVSAPEYLDMTDIESFVLQKLSWIHRQREEILEQPRQTVRHYVSGESHYLFGQRMLLRVTEEKGCTPRVSKMGEQLHLVVRPGTGEARRCELITEWQRENLKKYLKDAVKRWSETMKEENVDWKIKQMRAEWGSCQQKKRTLLFNLELARVPMPCIEYVIVHEMAHLMVANHSRLFEKRMEQFMPNWRQLRQQLNKFIAAYKEDSGTYQKEA